MVTIKNICNRLADLKVFSAKDKETFDYILDLVTLFDHADYRTQGSIIKLADNYLTSLELSYFVHFN